MAYTRNGVIALNAITAECRSAIEDIKTDKGATACKAHDAVCRGIIALLRCKVAELHYAQMLVRETKRTAAKLSAAVCLVAGAVYAIVDNLHVIIGIFR